MTHSNDYGLIVIKKLARLGMGNGSRTQGRRNKMITHCTYHHSGDIAATGSLDRKYFEMFSGL